MAVCLAEAVVRLVGPSGMMDGQAAIREALTGGPDRRRGPPTWRSTRRPFTTVPRRGGVVSRRRSLTYQQDPANGREALREVDLDLAEGADIIMVKPALGYLDVVAAVAARSPVPVAAYQVSGEYSMVEAAADRGWIDRDRTILETLTSIRRAGARIILTYWASEVASGLI
jgi:porphobilinogen synthase